MESLICIVDAVLNFIACTFVIKESVSSYSQVQIKYTKTDGRRFLRIITEEREATADRQKMEQV